MARILLAEDEAATRDLVRRALESDGHQVEVMEGGAEAVARLAAAPGDFQLLISDVNMPGMDGFELAKQARALNPGLRVLLMSGLVEQLDRAKAMKDQSYFTLSKPFSLEQVRSGVRAALGA